MTSWYFLQVPMLKDINNQMGQELCHMAPTNVLRSVIINREAPPFGKPEVRRAIALTLDRKAFIDTLTQGKGIIGGALMSPPFGVWGLPSDHDAERCPGYGPDVAANRAEARKLMEEAGLRAEQPDPRSRYRPATSRPTATRRCC